jgi:hypothetical protein
MICTTLFALSAPLLLSAPQYGQDYVIAQQKEYSSDVITARETANFPIGFATLGMTSAEWMGQTDLIIIRTDDQHSVLWERRIGGVNDEYPGNIIQTHDGGFLVSCFSFSTPASDQRAVLVKFDEAGHLLWAHSYRADDFFSWETRALVEQHSNGNLILLTSLGGEYSDSIAGGQHLLDPNGIPITMWRQEENWNLPVRLLYRDVAELDGKIVACGEITRTMTPAGFTTRNSFVALLSDTCGCGLWFHEYPVELTGRDWANSVEFAANGDLLVAGAKGSELDVHDGYIMRLSGDGDVMWTQVYPRLPLNGLVEEVSLSTDPSAGPLFAIGTWFNDPDLGDHPSVLPSMMLTDPAGTPLFNQSYDIPQRGLGVKLVRHYSSAGYSVDGVFGVATAFTAIKLPPDMTSDRQYWLRADPGLKTGCEETPYEQASLHKDTERVPMIIEEETIDGFSNLNWDPITPNLEISELCDDPPVYPALCFGDGGGTPCPCSNTGGLGRGCANSVGAGAILSGAGTASVASDSLVLSIDHGTLSQPVLFFQGMNFINSGNGNPFGDGLRCCGGGVRRLEVRFMDASGSASTAGALSISGSVSAGTTYCNQGWYRDPLGAGGSPCSTYFNLTNAISVTWAP